jgi:hypothetical protein
LRSETWTPDGGDFGIIKIFDAVFQPVFVGIGVSVDKRDDFPVGSVYAYVSLVGRFDGSRG